MVETTDQNATNTQDLPILVVKESSPVPMSDLSDRLEKQSFLGHEDTAMAPEAAPANTAHTKVLFLDGVRGLAAFLVFMQHTGEEPLRGLSLGSVAVDAFFVLSSFLLTWLFMKKSMTLLAQKAGPRSWGIALIDYFQKRFFRVYPLFALMAFVLSIITFDMRKHYFFVGNIDNYELSKALLFYHGHRPHVFWTLPLEIGYYFIIPVFVMGLLSMRRYWWLGALVLLVWICYEGFTTIRWHHMGLAPHLHTFLAGSLGAAAFVKSDMWIKRTGFAFRWWHIFILRIVEGLAIAMVLSVSFRGLLFDWVFENPFTDLRGFGFVSVQMTTVILIEIIRPSCVAKMFEWNVLQYWGKISFSMYLLHPFLVAYPPLYLQQNYFDRFVARFGLVLLFSTLSFYLIEYPSQLLAQKISRSLAARN
ncbi:hypothetical protein CCR75_005398 [Bremia lactucae]|uniref:Acyltransferase 3 domain-containing protein n=1 Tax=Bremia lactucae TaxID=4779 RepID=A0A976IEG5_BRELC|nr:hypothetical protein CCR75_005398 [Bremia lactucae]